MFNIPEITTVGTEVAGFYFGYAFGGEVIASRPFDAGSTLITIAVSEVAEGPYRGRDTLSIAVGGRRAHESDHIVLPVIDVVYA